MFGLECREKTANDGGRAGGLQSTALLGDGRMLRSRASPITITVATRNDCER